MDSSVERNLATEKSILNHFVFHTPGLASLKSRFGASVCSRNSCIPQVCNTFAQGFFSTCVQHVCITSNGSFGIHAGTMYSAGHLHATTEKRRHLLIEYALYKVTRIFRGSKITIPASKSRHRGIQIEQNALSDDQTVLYTTFYFLANKVKNPKIGHMGHLEHIVGYTLTHSTYAIQSKMFSFGE